MADSVVVYVKCKGFHKSYTQQKFINTFGNLTNTLYKKYEKKITPYGRWGVESTSNAKGFTKLYTTQIH